MIIKKEKNDLLSHSVNHSKVTVDVDGPAVAGASGGLLRSMTDIVTLAV
jgi:hypothetical protein